MRGRELLALIGRDTLLRKTSAYRGGEYSGGCPLCGRGADRFKVWPEAENGEGRWACLGPKAGRNGCDRGGDAIQYVRERDGLSYRAACERLGLACDRTPAPERGARGPGGTERGARGPGGTERLVPPHPEEEAPAPPNACWQAHGAGHAARCEALLWGEEGARARAYLHRRGLHDGVLRAFHVGYNPAEVYEDPSQWGLALPPGAAQRVWLPRGITLPWEVDGALWRINVRRPLSPAQIAAGEAKYMGPAGFGNALYNAGAIVCGRPVVLVEGEIDALTIAQACGVGRPCEAAAVATGSTAGARRLRWAARLARASVVLVAFDWDEPLGEGKPGAGERAAAWWLQTLPNARRLRPLLHDVNSLPDPEDVRAWIGRALRNE